ncbi:hypothetical protein FRB94_009509 [Tulasnella sp. JGI-2019a]|nr:hypothetical protein FRB94_009509 [Tulasnella sp. JGI-2019a]KAG9003142.1 hypothetical protein FRB93_011222 [Tulasnella sp. JGI-2019a]
MRNRGLIPQNMTLASSKNLIPCMYYCGNISRLIAHSFTVQATFRRAYGGHLWAFLPTEPVLLAHIAFEERHLCRRQTTHPDPGRLPYESSYLHFSPDANFNAYFVDNFEPFLTHDNGHSIVRHPSDLFPVRQLIASVNIVVSQAPTFIGDLGNVEAARTMSLVMYLRALWAASPATFRQLQRPRLIDFEIDRAEAYFETVPASIKGGSIGENETGEVPYTNNNVVDELVIDTPKLDVHVPGDR